MNKISILGCGWSGMALGKHLSAKGYTVKGSTTSATKMAEIAVNGIIPFHVYAAPVPDGPNLDEFFECDALVVTLPPPKRDGLKDWAFMVHTAIARKAVEYGVKKVVLMSSTSVYPTVAGEVTEKDAQSFESPRSGIAMLDLEKCYGGCWFNKVVLRFGGLFGPGRDPGKFLLPANQQFNPDSAVNLVHLDDVIGAITWALETDAENEIYNVVSPQEISRKQFYDKAANLAGVKLNWGENLQQLKRVSSEKIIQAGYDFTHDSALDAIGNKSPKAF